ncbi:MAG: hypothetical protein ABIF01_01665 [Candidatus Micrarchaeota archaeon]
MVDEKAFLMKDVGYWDALAWGSLFTLVLLLAYVLLRRKKNERETESFLSGESYDYSTPPNDFFYGFEKTLSWLFRGNDRFHSNVINEYVAWLLVFAAICSVLFIWMFLLGVRVV